MVATAVSPVSACTSGRGLGAAVGPVHEPLDHQRLVGGVGQPLFSHADPFQMGTLTGVFRSICGLHLIILIISGYPICQCRLMPLLPLLLRPIFADNAAVNDP